MSLCTALEMLSFEGVRFGFQSLAHDNYNQWESSMRHLLSIQGIWEIVNGQVTKSELDHQGFELRDKLAVALIQATVDLHVHPWVSGQFTSSKELWDSIKCQLQRKKKQKTKKKKKKKDKKQEPVLVVRSEISHLMLHVPEIHDSPSVSNCLENFLEEAACMENAQVLDGSDFLHISQVSNLHTICENDCSLILKDVAAQTDESTTILRDKYEGYLLEVEENGIESAFFDQLSQDIIHQLEVPIFDDYLEVADLSSLVESFVPDYAAAELILECNVTPSKGAYESMYQKLEWFPSRHDHLSHASLVSWDEVFEHQVHSADFKHELADELVVDLPWLNVDEKTFVFDIVMSQVHIQQQQLDLPLYICLNVPFSCTHGGKLEDYPNLDHCLGYISYADIGGLTKQLKVSYRCLHLRNQVLLVPEDSDLSKHRQNLLAAEGFHEIMESHLDLPVSAGQFSEFSVDSYQTQWFFYIRQNLVMNDSHVGKKREWFKGRKTWFKTRDLWQPWLLLWLTLLYFMSTA